MPRIYNQKTDKLIPSDAVYVGRPTMFGNPFHVAMHGRGHAVNLFEQYLEGRPDLKEAAKRELAGKDLVCWCAPEKCHAEILMRIANEV